MTGRTNITGGGGGNGWRIAAWGGAAALLLLPLVAMQFTDDVTWTASDFATFGAMLLAAGGLFELGMRMGGGWAYRAAFAVAVAAAFLLVWVNLAVGFLGSEDNPANLLFLGVFAVAGIGATLARFQTAGMARAMLATAVTQVLIGGTGLASGLASPGTDGIYEVVMGSSLFATLWLISAGLFRLAARRQVTAGAAA